jgi:hypothetical protein
VELIGPKIELGIIGIMGYKLFSSQKTQMGTAGVSITPSGQMRLNKQAGDILQERHTTHVHLWWDAENCRIAISKAREGEKGAYKLKYHPKGSGARFAAKAFIKFIGWNATKAVPIELQVGPSKLEAEIPRQNVGSPTGTTMRKTKTGL